MLKKWKDIPEFMKCEEVYTYWRVLNRKKGQLLIKRIFDIIGGILLLAICTLPMCVIAVLIKLDSKGPIFYRQERVTTYGRVFRIHKFRTMINNADKRGTLVTVINDNRITNVGETLRKYRLDELPQLIDVITGNMSFVGTRPEAVKYVEKYKPVYKATLLMPAGITSETSIRYKDEYKLLNIADDVDKVYIEEVLPKKMKHNLESIRRFNLMRDLVTLCRTICAVLGKDYK